ncbi:MAG: Ig-like domain repeat protein, partial [Acidobacteriaceae bacterium]
VWKTQNGSTSVYAGILAASAYTCTSGAATTVATTTPLAYPTSIALCGGNLFVASNGLDPFLLDLSTDTGGTLDEVDASGDLSVLPLPGSPGGGGGPLHPTAVACDAAGNVYVSSYYYIQDGGFSGVIDKFAPVFGGGWTTSTLGNQTYDQAYPSIAVNPANGDLYAILAGAVGEGWLGTPLLTVTSIQDVTAGTAGVNSGNSFFNADALAFDASGDIYISEAAGNDQYTSYVELVSSDGTKTVVAGNGTPGYYGDGGVGTSAEVNSVDEMVFDSSGNLYLADAGNRRIRRIHPLTAGPQSLPLARISVPQSSAGSAGSLQATLNPSGSLSDFYYVSGANTVNVISSGASVISPSSERIVAAITVGQGGAADTGSSLTLIADPTRNLIYVNNAADGKLYVIDGSYGNATSHTVVGSVALDNAGATLLAIDTGLNEIYVAGPNATSVTAVRGGTSPTVIGNAGFPASFVASLTVDPASHVVYAASDTGAGTGTEEALITMTPDPTTGVLTATNAVFPINEDVLQPAFIANSLAVDPLTGDLIASGAASIDTEFSQTYDAYDIFQFTPEFIEAPVPLSWPPLTTSLDIPNRVFYLTDFDGSILDASSHAEMVTGMDSVALGNNTLTSVSIPVFGSGAAPTSPHVYSIAPDTSSYQAWISGSDSNGGFVELWDSTTQTIAATLAIPNGGGGPLFVNPTNHSGYLLDQVNGVLWLINAAPWTNTSPPTFTPAQNGQSVTISATNSPDVVFYTLDGTPPGLGSTACNASCVVNLTQGAFTTINAIEVANVSGTQYASNVAQGVFTAPAPTSVTLTFAPSPATTGATITATATLTVASDVNSVTGTITFTGGITGGSTSTLCSAVAVANSAGTWQATCPFTEATVGSYTITAAFSGDPLNQPSNNQAVLRINQGTTPIVGEVGGESIALAINSNNAPGLAYNAVLNNDSSVSLVQNGSLLLNQGCPAYSALSGSTLSAGAIYVDAVNSRLYLAFLAGSYPGTLYATYESINTQGNCTQGPLLSLNTNPNSQVALNVDPVQGNVYVQNSSGAFPDEFYIVPTAPWSASSLPTPATVTLDYSAVYGPIEIDPSNHQVYINDVGNSAYGAAGTYATSGFFVYDPNHSSTPANNLQHVVGYSSSGGITQFNVGTLLDNGSGKLILINENPLFATANLTVPITILD